MGKRKLLFLTLSIFIFIIAYSVLATFSEDRKYGKLSIDYLILTPEDLSALSHICLDTPSFSYSSADGPKPAVISMTCQMEEAKVLDYLSRSQFTKNVDGSFKKDDIEIELVSEQPKRISSVTRLEFL